MGKHLKIIFILLALCLIGATEAQAAPTEYTEEQTEHNTDVSIKGTNAPTCGQKLTILNRTITKLAFYIKKEGSPTGDVTFTIRKVTNDSIIVSKVWGDAADLPTELTWIEVEFDAPTLINEEVRILIEHTGYDDNNYINSRLQSSNVKDNERWTRGGVGSWSEAQDWDFVYRYTYTEPLPEYTEEQTQYNSVYVPGVIGIVRLGQILTIPNRTVTKLGFWLKRNYSPTGPVTFAIRRYSDKALIVSAFAVNSEDVPTTPTYYEVEFGSPPTINEQVIIHTEVNVASANVQVATHYQSPGVKPDEWAIRYRQGQWGEYEDWDTAYRYKYNEVVTAPTATTNEATNIEETTATLNGEITDDGGEACQYRFEYDIDSGESYTSSTDWTGSVTTSQSFSEDISGLLKGTLYYFRAQARNSAGTSSASELTFLTKPEAPSDLSVTAKTKDSITLSWNKGESSQKTLIRYDTSDYPSSTSSGSLAHFDTGTTTTVNGLSSGQIYYFRAWSYTLKDSKEQYSDNTSDADDYTKPGDPSNLLASNPTDDSLDLSWTKGEGGDKTIIRRKTNSYPTSTTDGAQAYFDTETTTTDSNLDPNTTYYYRAWAYDPDSQYYSDSYSQTTDGKYTLANPPSNLLLTTDSPNQIVISWSANNNPSGTEYFCENITQGTNSDWITTLTWVNSDLLPGTEYTFRVKARNGDKVSTSWTEARISTLSAGGGASISPPISTTGSGNISQNLGGQVSQTFESGKIAKVVFPSYSIKGTVVSKIEPQVKTEVIKNNPLPQNTQIIGDLVADFKALSGIKEIESFEKEVIVTFTYTDKQITEAGIDEKTLKIYWWDKDTETWKPLKSEVNTLTNTITTYTAHFTLFAVMGETAVEEEVVEEKPIIEMTIEELKTKIAEIQQKIIELLSQLIQIIQEEIIQLRAQLP